MLDIFYASLEAFLEHCILCQNWIRENGSIDGLDTVEMYDPDMLINSGKYVIREDGAVIASEWF